MVCRLVVLLGIAMAFIPALCHGEETSEVSQYGITWRFERPAEVGRFVNGDWWVVGPVKIVSVTPAPGPAPADDRMEIKTDQYGVATHENDTRMRNGSMIVLKADGGQGYDSRGRSYDPALSIEFPYTLGVNESLISSVSHTSFPNPNFVHKIMWTSEKTSNSVLRTAAVLTCLAKAPPPDAFRPPYTGTEKPIYRARDLNWDLLLKLKPAKVEWEEMPALARYYELRMPDWEQFERYFQRVWLDHMPTWMMRGVVPTENQPGYYREFARTVSMASLMLHLDVPDERKKKLLIGFVQWGIDLFALSRNGRVWSRATDGAGRKWAILFAGMMLGEKDMQNLPHSLQFYEDEQTYYGEGWFGQTVLWQWGGNRRAYEESHPEAWSSEDRLAEGYRGCCNAQSWIGEALAARLMKAMKVWGHDAFFDYCDRWMRQDDPYAEARGGHKRPGQEGSTYDPWVDAMWHAYRKTAPEQEGAEKNMKWLPGEQRWVPNPKPGSK